MSKTEKVTKTVRKQVVSGEPRDTVGDVRHVQGRAQREEESVLQDEGSVLQDEGLRIQLRDEFLAGVDPLEWRMDLAAALIGGFFLEVTRPSPRELEHRIMQRMDERERQRERQ